MLTSSTTIATPSASQRAKSARPLPANDTSAPPRIGSQITRLSRFESIVV
jgi:hypothetical protein